MPRKSAASVTAAPPADDNGDVSMISEAPTTDQPSSPKAQQQNKEDAPKQSKKKEQPPGQQQQSDVVSLDDLLLPRSIIQRLSKGVLPPNTSLQRDAVLALTKSATVFISLLASTANEMTDRKTIQSQDVLEALKEIELDQVMQLGVLGKDGKRGGRLEREVEVWESEVRGKRRGYRERVKARESGTGDTTLGDTTMGSALDADENANNDEEHESKRPRIDAERLAEKTGREGSTGTTGTIEQGTNRLKLNVGRRKPEPDDEGEVVNEDVEDEAESEEEDFESAEEEQEPDETQEVEDSINVDDDASTMRKNGKLAPDGRVEIDGSDVESD